MTTTLAPGHIDKAREFIARSRYYSEQGDLHQASEKGWGAAAHIAKAVAHVNGLRYEHHDQFDGIIDFACQKYRQPRLESLGNAAHFLHHNYYKHPSMLNSDRISTNIGRIEEMVDVLVPFLIE